MHRQAAQRTFRRQAAQHDFLIERLRFVYAGEVPGSSWPDRGMSESPPVQVFPDPLGVSDRNKEMSQLLQEWCNENEVHWMGSVSLGLSLVDEKV